MPVEGRWITWRDQDGAEQIARADVPGNESARGPKLTPEQLARSIAWTRAHPEWLQQAQQEADARADDAARLGAPAGQFRYVDSRTGEFFTAPRAPDPQYQWRLVATPNEVQFAFDEGEVAAQVPTNFDLASPQEQQQIVRDSIIRDYEEGARYQQQVRQLQERWGVQPAPPEGAPRPEQVPTVEDLGPVEPDAEDTPEPPPGPESALPGMPEHAVASDRMPGLTPLSPEQTQAVQAHLERKQNGAGPSLGAAPGTIAV